MNKFYADKLTGCIDKVLNEFTSETPNEDVFYVALAGMKEVSGSSALFTTFQPFRIDERKL